MFVACLLICADCKKSRETHYASERERESQGSHQGPVGVSSSDDPVGLLPQMNIYTVDQAL